MAKETIEKKLYDLLKTRDYKNFQALDSQTGKVPVNPETGAQDVSQADMFTFDWNSSRGKDYGTAVILLTPEHELELYFGDNLGKTMEDPEDRDEWFAFMEQLRHFANRTNFNGFRPLNINQLRHSLQGQAAIREGLFESWQGRKNLSWSGDPTEARLMIRHKHNLDEHDARHRYIESLFIETAEGERYKLPFTKLAGGRAMLEHVRQGGKPYDMRGQHIVDIVEELNVLGRFERSVSRETVLEGDTATLVSDASVYRKNLKDNLKRLGTKRGYTEYFESWNPVELSEQDVVIEGLKHMFVKQTLDARIEQALPLLARIQQQGNVMKEANIFEAWADRLVEGTWSIPDTPESQKELIDFMSREQPVGADATDATEQLYGIFGDDRLFDSLSDLAEQDPNADCRQLVLDRLQELSDDPDIRAVLDKINTDADTEMNPPESVPADLGNQDDQEEKPDKVAGKKDELAEDSIQSLRQAAGLSKKSTVSESLRPGEYHVWTVHFDDGTTGKIRLPSDEIDPADIKAHYAKKGQTVVKIDPDYSHHSDMWEDRTVVEGSKGKVRVNLNGHAIGYIERDTVADDDGVIGLVGVVYDGTNRPYTLHGYKDRNELKQAMAGVYKNRVAKKGVAEGSDKVDMTGKKCTACKKGTYQETSMHDDMDGVLHCNKCNKQVTRWQAPKQQGMSEGRFEFDKKTGQMAHNREDSDQRHGLYIGGKLVKTYNTRDQAENVKKRDPRFKNAEIKKIAESTNDIQEKIQSLRRAAGLTENVLRDSTGSTLDHIANTFKRDIKDFEETNNLSDELYDALYDYYCDDMPYGTKKGRTGDPYEWIANRITQDLNLNPVDASPWKQTKDTNADLFSDFEEERDPHSVDGGMGNDLLQDNMLGRVAGSVAGAEFGPTGSAVGGAIGDTLTDESACNMTEAGEMCPVHGLDECWSSSMPVMANEEGWGLNPTPAAMESKSPLAGQYGHSGRMQQVDQDLSFLDRLKALSGIVRS